MKKQIPSIHPSSILAALTGLILSTGSADAAIVQVDTSSAGATSLDGNVSATDLINEGAASLGSYSATSAPSWSATGAHDGDAQDGTTGNAFWNSTSTLTYTLTGNGGLGYDITEINTIYGWTNGGSYHADQNYTVWIKTVSNPTLTQLHDAGGYTGFTGDEDGATQVNLTNSGGGALDNGSGVVATGVTEIQFVLTDGGVVREFDVQGVATVPEPGSLALLGLGGLCVLRRRRG